MLHTRVLDLVKEQGVVKGVIVRNGSRLMTIPCSLVIAADGPYQHMARLAGIEMPVGVVSACIGCEFVGVKSLTGSRNIDEIYLGDFAKGRNGWVAPYAEDRFSVGLGVGRDAAKQKKSLKERLDEMIRHLERIGKYDFSKASPDQYLVADAKASSS
jgi:digeranylgeranylglycerophospholipid reductase